MKKTGIVLALLAVASFAQANMWQATISVAKTSTVERAVNIAGYIDRVEIVQDGGTNDVTLATYVEGTKVTEIVALNDNTSLTKTIVPRLIGTDKEGTSLAGANIDGTNKTASTVLVGVYEKILGEGMKLTLKTEGPECKISVRIYYTKP